MPRHDAPRSGLSRWLMLAALSAAVSACSVSAAAMSPPPATPRATAASAASQPTSVPGTPAASSTGPVDYALWVERQGFGGSSGLHQVVNEVTWLQNNPRAATLYDVDDSTRRVDHLATWLDEHPPTACWADYHATVRAALGRMLVGLEAVHAARTNGEFVPADVASSLVAEAKAAYELAAPAC